MPASRPLRIAKRIAHLPVALTWRARRERARVAARRSGSAVVLYYHRIGTPEHDPWRLAVSPSMFAAQLDYLTSELNVVPLSELVAAIGSERLEPGTVAITFDDGYVDNLEHGLPLLERYRAPATIYVASGQVDTVKPFWWDELCALLLDGELPDRLDQVIAGHHVKASLQTPEERRRALLVDVQPLLRAAPPETIERELELLRTWARRRPVDAGASIPRAMTRDELLRLAASDLIELGAHTVHHPSLPALSPAEQRSEVERSRDFLVDLLGQAPRSFAYPYGDNSAVSRRIVREAGFDHAVGVQEYMPVTVAAPRYEIPRAMAVDESGAALAARIQRVLDFGEWR